MYYTLNLPFVISLNGFASVLFLLYGNHLFVGIDFYFSLFASPNFGSFLLPLLIFGFVFSDGKIHFSQYLLTQDRVKLFKGNRVVAEEGVFQLFPRSGNNDSELPSYENFLAFNEELDEKLEFAYEVTVYGKKVSSCFYVFTQQPSTEEEVLDTKVQSILSAFNLNTDYMRMSFDVLENVFLGMIGGKYFSKVRKIKGEKNILLLESGGRVTYVAVILFKGSPDYESLDPGCMDFFVKSIQNLDVDVSLVIPFRFIKVGESENILKKDLKVRILVNGKNPVKYIEVSPYLVVRGPSLESVRNHLKRVSVAASAAWSGIKKRISVDFLDSDETKKLLHNIICRRLLPEREVFRIKNLSTYLRIPTQVVGEMKPPVLIPGGELKDNNHNNNRILLGKTALGGYSVPVWMDYNNFSKHMVILGDSAPKTWFLLSLLNKISKPWIVFDFKGEFCKLKDFRSNSVSFFTPGSDLEPLRINLFDSKEKSPDAHTSLLLSVFKKISESDFDIVEDPLRKILSHFCNKSRYKQGLKELNRAFDEILVMDDSREQSAVGELAVMLHSLQQGVLDKVFNGGDSNLDLKKLTNESVVIDLTQILPEVGISELKFLVTYILMQLFNGLPKGESETRHITVINGPENNSELINFLTNMIFSNSYQINNGEGLILSTSQLQDLNGIDNLNSYYKIIFNGVRETKKIAEIIGISSEIIEGLDDKVLMIIPETEKQVIFHPDYDESLATDKASCSQVQENQLDIKFKKSDAFRDLYEEIRDKPSSENPATLLNGDFVTADVFLRGLRNPNKISFDSSYNLSKEQIEAFVEKISHMLEREMYLTDIHISRLTGLPCNTVNKIMREALETDAGIQRIYLPVVGDKANIPLYYSKFGPKYESVQDKYLKDILEELCFKTGIQWSLKRDPETGADGQIDSHSLKLFIHTPEENELKSMLQKLFLKFNQVAVLFLYDKDFKEAEKRNSQWRIPLVMGCLSNLNAFLKEIRMASTEKILNQTYTGDKDLQELISWLEADT